MRTVFFSLFLLLSAVGFSQTNDLSEKDSIFQVARNFAFEGEYEKSIVLLQTIPTLEAKQTLARVFAWSGEYNNSLTISNQLILEFPKVVSNYQIAATTALWGSMWSASYKFAKEGLQNNGDELIFKTIQIKALMGDKKWTEAELLCKATLLVDPKNEILKKLLQLIQQKLFQKEILLNHTQDYFTLDSSLWKNTSFIMKNKTKYGPLIISANHSNRFNLKGLQGELEFYPKIDSNYYAYIDVGLSNTELFPNFRNGASIFRTFKKGYELELGYRNMNFKEAGNVWFYLGSATKYFGNNSLTYRFTSIHSPEGQSATHGLKLTHFFKDEKSTLSAEVGSGSNARDYQAYGSVKPFSNINSKRLQIDYRRFINHRIAFSITSAYESAVYRENQQGQRITLGVGLSSKF